MGKSKARRAAARQAARRATGGAGRAVPATSSDLGSPFLAQHVPTAIVDRSVLAGGTVGQQGRIVLETVVLDAYLRRGMIRRREHEAGQSVSALWRRFVLPPAVTASYGQARGGGGGLAPGVDASRLFFETMHRAGLAQPAADLAPLEIRGASKTFVEPAMARYVLTAVGHVVVAVCGYEEWAGGTRRIEHLRAGLGRLADHWRIPS
jgi:hypothetical protein